MCARSDVIFCACDLKPKEKGGGEGGREGEEGPLPSFFSNGNLGMRDNGVKNVGSNPLCLGVRPLRFHHFIRKWLISPLEEPDKACALMQGESKFKQPSMF